MVLGCYQPATSKLVNPIHGVVTPTQAAVEPGGTVRVTLQLAATRSFERVAVEMQLPADVLLLSGAEYAELAGLGPEQGRELTFSVRVNTAEERVILFTARALGLVNEAISQVFALQINPEPKAEVEIQNQPDGSRHRVQPLGLSKP